MACITKPSNLQQQMLKDKKHRPICSCRGVNDKMYFDQYYKQFLCWYCSRSTQFPPSFITAWTIKHKMLENRSK